MNNPTTRDPTAPTPAADVIARPWYRYFWPWLVIALVSSAVGGSLVSAYFAVHTRDVVLEHADASE